MTILVRRETPADHPVVGSVHAAAFGDHDISAYTDELRPSASVSLVAEIDSVVVGHILFSPALLDTLLRDVTVQMLSPLGVLPSYQRMGVGSALVRAGLEVVDTPAVFLEGSPVYYRRFGFVAGQTLGFRRPSLRIPQSCFQVVPLAGHEPWMTGTLVYPQVVWDHDAVGLRGEELARVLAHEAASG